MLADAQCCCFHALVDLRDDGWFEDGSGRMNGLSCYEQLMQELKTKIEFEMDLRLKWVDVILKGRFGLITNPTTEWRMKGLLAAIKLRDEDAVEYPGFD